MTLRGHLVFDNAYCIGKNMPTTTVSIVGDVNMQYVEFVLTYFPPVLYYLLNCNIIFDPRCVCICLPTVGNIKGNIQSPSAANLATLQSYRPLVNDVYAPPSLGFSQGSSGSQVPQSKYSELLAIIEELGKEIRPTYAGSKSAMERLKRGIIHARGLVRECLAETERNARS
uniref:Cyclin dependent kinase 2 associated protein 1 n=1 Tax=Salmo trutta TaxID=8032 RepID=A0A673Z0A1_SALTR